MATGERELNAARARVGEWQGERHGRWWPGALGEGVLPAGAGPGGAGRGGGVAAAPGGLRGPRPPGAGAGAGAGERGRGGARAGWRSGAFRAVAAAGQGDGERCRVPGVGRGRAGAVLRCRGAVSRGGRACRSGAGQGRRLAGGVRAGDRGGVAARRCHGVHAWWGAVAACAAAALVGAGGWRGGPVGAALRGGGGRAVLRARGVCGGSAAAGRDVRPVEQRPGRCARIGGRVVVGGDAGATGRRGRGHASGVPRHHVGRHGEAAGGARGRGFRARPAGHERTADGRPVALLGGGGHARACAAYVDAADGGSRGAAVLGFGSPLRARGSRRRGGSGPGRRRVREASSALGGRAWGD